MTNHARGWAVLIVLVATGCSSSGEEGVTSPAPSITAAGSTLVALPTVATDDDDQGIGPPTPDEFPPAEVPRVCLMVSLDEVTGATGVTAVSGEEGVFREVTTCFVKDEAGETLVSIAAGPASGFTDVASAPDARVVDGLGDGAVWTEGKLHVQIGAEVLAFKLFPAADVANAAAESVIEAIATGTLSRYAPPPPDDPTP